MNGSGEAGRAEPRWPPDAAPRVGVFKVARGPKRARAASLQSSVTRF